MIAFFRGLYQKWQDRRCRLHDHYWKDEPVMFGNDPSSMVRRSCKRCGSNYVYWKDAQ